MLGKQTKHTFCRATISATKKTPPLSDLLSIEPTPLLWHPATPGVVSGHEMGMEMVVIYKYPAVVKQTENP